MIKTYKIYFLSLTSFTLGANTSVEHMHNKMDMIGSISNWFSRQVSPDLLAVSGMLDADVTKKSTCCTALLSQINAKLACGHTIPISPAAIGRVGFTINSPGEYCLTLSTTFNPLSNNVPAITINSDNVILHLNNNVLSKAGTATGTSGVVVNSKNNVVIDGGTIMNFDQYGIQVNPASSYVTISNVNIFGCGAAEIAGGGIGVASAPNLLTHDVLLDHVNASGNIFTGLTLAGVNNALVKNSKFNNNAGTFVTAFGGINVWGILATPILSGIPCTNVTIIDTQMNGNTGLGGSIGFEAVSVPPFGLPFNQNFNIIRCEANGNTGGGAVGSVNEGEGIVLAGVRDFVVEDCIAQGNATLATAPSGAAGSFASVGFGVPFSCINGSFINCVAQNNTGNGDVSAGFRITHSNQIAITNCKASGNNNTAGEAWGFTTDTNIGNPTAFDAPVNTNYVFENCIAEKNLATTGLSGGFKFISQVNSILSYCQSLGNAVGILVGDPACCPAGCNAIQPTCSTLTCCPSTHNIISNNTIIGNTAFGIHDVTTTANNAYYANFARSNGAVGNNYVGLPAGTPIRIWTLPAAPSAVDSNGILDPQLDNLDIRP